MNNKKLKKGEFKLSVRLYDEKFNVVFGITKEDYKEALIQIDKLLRLKLDENIEKILSKRKK